MLSSETVIGRLFLRFLPRLTMVRGAPVVGRVLHAVSRVLLPPEARVCVRIRKGPGKGLLIGVNPRTGTALYEGAVEPLVQEAVREHLGAGMVFYDIGANIGLFSLIAARRVGKDGKVFAFEPDPEVSEELKRNIWRNGFSQVEVIHAAVSSTTGSGAFLRASRETSPDLGLGRLDTSRGGSSVDRVRTVALDDFVRSAPLPDVIKCDVEGAELDVLQGARSILERRKPVVVCEIHKGVEVTRISDFVHGLGYGLKWLDRNHVLCAR